MVNACPPYLETFLFSQQFVEQSCVPHPMSRLILTLLALATLHTPAAELLRDDFSEAAHPVRKPTRGTWKVENGSATCAQDDALYAKFKNHGPVIWYDVKFTDATLTFQFKPDATTKTFVFTLNGAEGHVFRFVSSSRGTGIRAFPPEPPDHQSIALGKTGPALQPGQWTAVKVTLSGSQATVQIGDSFSEVVTHPSLARAKTTVGLGFSFGTLSLKDLVVTAPAQSP